MRGPPAARVLWGNLATAVRVDWDALVWPPALRRMAGVAVCLFGGPLVGQPTLGVFAGIGAQLAGVYTTSYGGRREVTAVAPAVLTLAAATTIGVVCHVHTWLVVPLAAVFAAATGFLTGAGAPWATIGVALSFGFVVTGAIQPVDTSAVARGLAVATGGLVQLLLVAASWPSQQMDPERRTLRLVLRDIARQLEAPSVDEPVVPPAAALPTLSTALTRPQPFARPAVVRSVRAEYRAILELRRTVARFRLATLRAEAADETAIAVPARAARQAAARVCRQVIGRRLPGWRQRATTALAELRAARDSWPDAAARGAGREALAATRAFVEQLEAVAAPFIPQVDPPRRSWDPQPALDVYAPPGGRSGGLRKVAAGTRAVLGDPRARRHAARLAFAVTVAVILGQVLPVDRGYWIGLVVLVALRPAFAHTTGRIIARSVGTVLGVAVALPLLALLGDHRTPLLIAGVVLSGLAMLTFQASYFLFSVGVTAYICLLLTVSGGDIASVSIARLVDTGIGLAIVVAVSLLAPIWERGRVGDQLADALSTQLDYLGLALERLERPVSPDAITSCEARAVDARLAAQESLGRLRLEPWASRRQYDELGPTLVRLLRVQAERSLVMHAQIDAGDADEAAVRCAAPLRAALPTVAADLCAAVRARRPPPPLPPGVSAEPYDGDGAPGDGVGAAAQVAAASRNIVAIHGVLHGSRRT